MNLDQLNKLPTDEAVDALSRCCAATRWANEVAEHRPYASNAELFEAADDIWWKLDGDDWLEAFDGHPKIGDIDSLRKKYASSRSWSEGEQSGVEAASDDVLHRLAEANDEYEEKFGYIFIVCATGKSAAEMLDILEERLPNSPDDELPIAAAEQAKITRIRLEKLLD